MIGHCEVAAPERPCRRRELLEGRAAVARRQRVHVEVAEEVRLVDEPRQSPRLGRLELARALAQLGRDERQPHRPEDVELLCTSEAAARPVEDAVLRDSDSAPHRAGPERHVVVLAPREVVQRRPEALRRQHPQVRLDPGAQARRRLRRSVREHRREAGERAEGAHDRGRVLCRDEQVEVAHRLLATAQAPGRLRAPHAGDGAQPGEDRLRVLERAVERHPPRPRPVSLDRAEQRPRARGAHARRLEDAARATRVLEGGEVGDAESPSRRPRPT